MKKYFIIFICLMTAVICQAQLTVDNLGRAQVKSINAFQDSYTTNPVPYGISSRIEGLSELTSCAVSGQISGITTGLTLRNIIGVKGYAEGSNGMCYGVVGSIPSYNLSPMIPLTYGAAIYGTNYNSLLSLDDVYAGYFDGHVKISGNLQVTGYLNGLVLSNPFPSRQGRDSNSFSERITENLSQLLSSLKVGTFYLETPKTDAPILDAKTLEPASPELIEEYNLRQQRIDRGNSGRLHYGITADQLEETFPDLVYENEDGTKSINYVEMVPILVQVINEMGAKIEALENGETNAKRAIPSATDINSADENVTLLSLGQNKPNPFGETTSIAVSIPADVQTAFLYVYNLNGSKVAQVDIPARGKTSITLSAATLSEGMFLYSLVADGKIVQTRRMIVEK